MPIEPSLNFHNEADFTSRFLVPLLRRLGYGIGAFAYCLAHPNQFCPRFQVFGVYDGDDDRFVFAVQEFDEQERAERVARRMMEDHGADHFERAVRE